jgi:hypothetical protein
VHLYSLSSQTYLCILFLFFSHIYICAIIDSLAEVGTAKHPVIVEDLIRVTLEDLLQN